MGVTQCPQMQRMPLRRWQVLTGEKVESMWAKRSKERELRRGGVKAKKVLRQTRGWLRGCNKQTPFTGPSGPQSGAEKPTRCEEWRTPGAQCAGYQARLQWLMLAMGEKQKRKEWQSGADWLLKCLLGDTRIKRALRFLLKKILQPHQTHSDAHLGGTIICILTNCSLRALL